MSERESADRRLNKRQTALIELMARFPYPRMAAAARQLDVLEDTARKWNQQPAFKRALEAAYADDDAQVRERVTRTIKGLSESAVRVKADNLKAESAHVRHLESSWILEHLLGKAPQKLEHSGSLELLTQLLTTPQTIEVPGPPEDLADFES